MAKKHMKRCSASFIFREMEIKTIMRYHLMPIRIAAIQKSTNKFWRKLEKREPSYTDNYIPNWYSRYGKQYGVSLRN